MLFGFGDELKPLRQELKITGADMDAVREWSKVFEKIKSNYPKVQNLYLAERDKLNQLKSILKHMEDCFVEGGNVKKALYNDAEAIKKMKGFTGHELLIDKGNAEFELTFSRMKKAVASMDRYTESDMLFLHSETENLLDMVNEALEKEIPNLHALTYFVVTRDVKELVELPHAEKIKKVQRIYDREFVKPMERILSAAIDKSDISMSVLSQNKDKTKEERINYIMEEWIWK